MGYRINDKSLIDELRGEDFKKIIEEQKKELVSPDRERFVHPLDDSIIGKDGELAKLISDGSNKLFSYSAADKLDALWRILLDKSIQCLRYFDNREPFQDNNKKPIVAYGINNLEEYHKKYTKFESLMYGANAYYRDHVFHAVRVWMLGVFCLVKKDDKDGCLYSQLSFDGTPANVPRDLNFFECISMWTIAALCHDLGYPLEKAENILDSTRKMMKEFIPNPNIWNNFGYTGTQDSINDYILKFISTKMVLKKEKDIEESVYVGRIQPKYYLKYAKSLENFKHGIISTVIVYKMLLYFLEADFNLNDDYTYKMEDAHQFYIRREILRAMASHTCPDAYNVHLYTFPSLLFLCDELQEWGRKTWNELYTGLTDDSVVLTINKFKKDIIDVSEKIDMTNIEDEGIALSNVCRIFERQYSLYKTTFRDGQHTATRDFELKKSMSLNFKPRGATESSIEICYRLPKDGVSEFIVNLANYQVGDKRKFKEDLEKNLSHSLYYDSLVVKTESVPCIS